jgi:uncharacterized protein (DUF1697 family)
MKIYAAFLRGINVGGHKKVKMDILRNVIENCGSKNVHTLLASGNVLFESDTADESDLVNILHQNLQKTFGFEIGIIIRSLEELKNLAALNPFREVKLTPETRRYITFLPDGKHSTLKIPYESADGNYKVFHSSDREVCSVLTITKNSRSVDLMNVIEQEFGKNVTTRNWNTVEKLLKIAEQI